MSPRTLVWYRIAFKNYQAVHNDTDLPTKATLQAFVVALRQRGIRPVTCNTYIGAELAVTAKPSRLGGNLEQAAAKLAGDELLFPGDRHRRLVAT